MRKLLLLPLLLALAVASSGSDSFAYIYSDGGRITHIRNNTGSIETVVKIAKKWSGEYVWLERGGRQYLIRDAGVLAEVRAAFADLHAFEPVLRAAEKRFEPLEKEYDRLSDSLDEDEDDGVDRSAVRARLRQLRPRYEAAEREVERLEREDERLEKIAEDRFEKIVLRAVREGKAKRVE